MPYEVYKVIHLGGILCLFMALGALTLNAMSQGPRGFIGKRWVMVFHGLGLFLVLLGGFGLLARLGIIGGFPGWVWIKLVIWFVLGGIVMAILRKPQWAKSYWLISLFLGILAAYFAGVKPF